MFGSWKLIIAGVLALAVVSIIGIGYAHYNGLLAENATLRDNNARLELALASQRGATDAAMAAVDEWKKSRDELNRRLEEMADAQRAAGTQARKLNELFAKHDLSALVLERPDALQRRINTGTAAALRLLECSSHPGGQCPAPGGAAGGAGTAGPTEPGATQPEVRDGREGKVAP
jgi:hypothetical protein